MTGIPELQQAVAEALEADPVLREAGVRVLPENRGDVGAEAARALAGSGGLVGIVSTPDADCMGGDAEGGIHLAVDALAVTFLERPALNRRDPSRPTAWRCAERAALALHGERFALDSIRQEADTAEGTEVLLSATATFHTSATILETP